MSDRARLLGFSGIVRGRQPGRIVEPMPQRAQIGFAEVATLASELAPTSKPAEVAALFEKHRRAVTFSMRRAGMVAWSGLLEDFQQRLDSGESEGDTHEWLASEDVTELGETIKTA